MNAEQLEQLISRYNDPDLTEQEQAQLKEVLRDNAEAQELLRQYKKLDEALANLPDVTSTVDQGRFTADVKEALAKIRRNKPGATVGGGRFRLGWPMRVAALVVVGLLAVTAYKSLTGDGGGSCGPVETEQSASPSTAQAEHNNGSGIIDIGTLKFGAQAGANRLADFQVEGGQLPKPRSGHGLNGIMKPLSIAAPEPNDDALDENAENTSETLEDDGR
ncbi:MAG: hypothetical protein JW936_09670 [Sedimentisphaerales bacterium]|nr:hypothetical protein [Sedimentisphaerales bacterium]